MSVIRSCRSRSPCCRCESKRGSRGRRRRRSLQVRLYPDDVHVDHHDPRLTARRGRGREALLDERPRGHRRRSGVGATVEGRRSDARDLGARGAHAHERLRRPDVSGRRDRRRQRGHRGDRARAARLVHRSRALSPAARQIVQGQRDPGQPAGRHLLRRRSHRNGAGGAARRRRRDARSRRGHALDGRLRRRGRPSAWPSPSICRRKRTSCRTWWRSALPVEDADGAALIAALVESHRLSDGAAFIPPGTPTNNLADSASGYSITAVPPPGPARRAGGRIGRRRARGRVEHRPDGARPDRRRRQPRARRGRA